MLVAVLFFIEGIWSFYSVGRYKRFLDGYRLRIQGRHLAFFTLRRNQPLILNPPTYTVSPRGIEQPSQSPLGVLRISYTVSARIVEELFFP